MKPYLVNINSLKLSPYEHSMFYYDFEKALLTEVLPDYALSCVQTYEISDRFIILVNRLLKQHNICLIKNPSSEVIVL